MLDLVPVGIQDAAIANSNAKSSRICNSCIIFCIFLKMSFDQGGQKSFFCCDTFVMGKYTKPKTIAYKARFGYRKLIMAEDASFTIHIIDDLMT